jgi:L-ascorbate metabolism protein UlaG (beta-lactamase superfamily)
MQIQYQGQTAFALNGSDASVALHLPSEKINNADIIIPAKENAQGSKVSGNVFDWPGEYEANGISVQLIPVGKESPALVAKIIVDNIAIAHLDNLQIALTEKEEERIGSVDVLLISIGKNSALSEKQIKNTIEAIEPKIIIPMNFESGEEKEFAKSMGFGEVEEESDLKLKASSLPTDRMELKILKNK